MKSLILVVFTLFSFSAMANSVIEASCTQDDYTVNIGTATIGGKGNGSVSMPMFFLHQNDKPVGSGSLKLLAEGYEGDLLNSYFWIFEASDGNSMIALAVPNLKTPTPGEYDAKSELLIATNGHLMNGATVDCKVTIK